MELFEELEQEGIDRGLLEAIRAFRAEHPVPQEAQGRLIRPKLLYYGREVWQAAATALLCGENLLLSGPKATGKNVLAENLAAAFGRPVWNVSMYVNIDAASLIGADTLFQDLRDKCQSGEISTRTLDLRGLLAALRLIEHGLTAGQALELGLVNKAFDPYERQLAADVIAARIPREACRGQLMED